MSEPWFTVNSQYDLPRECGYFWVALKDNPDDVKLMETHRIEKFGYIFNECVIDGLCYESVDKVGILAWKKAHIPKFERG